jgi:hypothetical protein
MTNYHHYSNNIIKSLENKKYEQNNLKLKPTGFWFCKNTEWYEWCIDQRFSISGIDNKYKLDINFEEILIIDTIEKLLKFTDEYSLPEQLYSGKRINWIDVSTKYKGIYFDNYLDIKYYLSVNNLMIDFVWYYSIDVSSGCIFNIDIVKDFSISN